MDLDQAIETPAIAMEIVLTVLPTMDTDMVAGIMVTAIKAAVNAVAMAAHPVGHIGIDHDETWYRTN